MRVYIHPQFNLQIDKGEGGIKRVVEALHRWLPEYGVEVVSDPRQADLINVHADEFKSRLPVAASSHGLYWDGYWWEGWCYHSNAKLIRMMKQAQATSVPSRFVHNAFARGMLLDPFVLQHGVELDDWEPAKDEGYVVWLKSRTDDICTPQPLNTLAAACPNLNFVSTFGSHDLPNVTLTGKLTHDKARAVIAHASVYLATVLETGNITTLECAAAGVPALGFDWGANQETIVHQETGYLVPPHDYNALREGLYYCLEHRDRLGQAAREHVRQNFQWRERVGDYLPFYQQALDEDQPDGPKVSVIVTAYNLERYLPACLDSVLHQDFTDWECIIVDDASPDSCGRIADEYAARDSRFKVIHNPANLYLAEARNVGLRASRGQYLLALDADDEVGPGSLGILTQALDKNPDQDIVTGAFELINPNGTHWVSGWPSNTPSYHQQIRKRNQVPYASMYRRWVWQRTGGYRRRWKSAEDAEFWTRAMSYGATPAKVTDAPSLIYNIRPDSMSHANQEPNWTAWFPWARLPEVTPFGCSGEPPERAAWPVHNYHPPQVSVVIPVGPGHETYLQDCLDSVVAQTYQDWEVVVVNDTGEDWSTKSIDYTQGYPFARFLAYDPGHRGVSAARNRGIRASTAPYFVLLDADDYAQPYLLDILYAAVQKYGGWCYVDWYDQLGEIKEARDFNFEDTLGKMPGPVTGIYKKSDWEWAGGFDEHAPGWEDWILQLSLMSLGICGNHVRYPGFTYRYQTGTRREDNFAKQDSLLKYIRDKFQKLYTQGEFRMACKKCGGGGGANVTPQLGSNGGPAAIGELEILIEYTGNSRGKQRLRSKIVPRQWYVIDGPGHRFRVYRGDVEWLAAMRSQFKVVEEGSGLPAPILSISDETARLVSETRPADFPLDVLDLDPIVLGLLKRRYQTISELRRAGEADWLLIKGMGAKRAELVKEALSVVRA